MQVTTCYFSVNEFYALVSYLFIYFGCFITFCAALHCYLFTALCRCILFLFPVSSRLIFHCCYFTVYIVYGTLWNFKLILASNGLTLHNSIVLCNSVLILYNPTVCIVGRVYCRIDGVEISSNVTLPQLTPTAKEFSCMDVSEHANIIIPIL